MNKYLSMLNLREIHNYVIITRSLNVPISLPIVAFILRTQFRPAV